MNTDIVECEQILLCGQTRTKQLASDLERTGATEIYACARQSSLRALRV